MIIDGFKKVTENEICEFGYYGMSKSITEHLGHLKENHFCLVAKNKQTDEMNYLIFDKEQNIIKEGKSAESLLYWIDGLMLSKYGTAKPWLTNYELYKEKS